MGNRRDTLGLMNYEVALPVLWHSTTGNSRQWHHMVKYVHWKVKFKRSNFIKIQFYLIRRCIIHFIRDGEVQPEHHVDSKQ